MEKLSPRIGAGLDVGGSRTRWALADPERGLIAQGEAGGFSAWQMASESGRANIRAVLTQIAAQMQPYRSAHARFTLHAGMTGFGLESNALTVLMREVFALEDGQISLGNDLEIAYHAAWAPGQGYVVYAGTGSIAAYIDAQGGFHRAGGRGYLLDDGGSAYWIASRALRAIWRQEDEAPDNWRYSVLAQALFDHLGGSDWSVTREFVYHAERGEIARLAMIVAKVADQDRIAQRILIDAGTELARLAQVMMNRFGARPIVLSGRAASLHPLIETSMRAALPGDTSLTLQESCAHHAAAGLALKMASPA